MVPRDAAPGVRHLQRNAVIVRCHPTADRAPGRGEPERVREQVGEDLERRSGRSRRTDVPDRFTDRSPYAERRNAFDSTGNLAIWQEGYALSELATVGP